LITLFEEAIRKAFPQDQNLAVTVVPGRQTDFQCNSAMAIAAVGRNLNQIKFYIRFI
jgi:hypothetical protein